MMRNDRMEKLGKGREGKYRKGGIALLEIALLVLGVIAISYTVGGSIPSVSAQTVEEIDIYEIKEEGNMEDALNEIRREKGLDVDIDTLIRLNDATTRGEKGLNPFQITGGEIDRDQEGEIEVIDLGKMVKGTKIIIPDGPLLDERPAQTSMPGIGTMGGQFILRRAMSEWRDEGGTIEIMVDGEPVNAVLSFGEGELVAREVVDGEVGEVISTERITGSNVVERVEDTGAANTGWFKGHWEGYFKPEVFSLDTLQYAGVTFLVAGVVKMLHTAYITGGDWGRATEAGIRVGGSAAVGYATGKGITSALVAAGMSTGPAGWIIAGTTAAAIWASKFLKRQQDREIIFECRPWQPQSGGESDCERCNEEQFPCTEYQCRSLGAGCELENQDTSDPRCVWRDDKDVNPPEITPWAEPLPEGYNYDPLPRGEFGVEITHEETEDGCLPAFQPFEFGVELDREGHCRIEFERTEEFRDMSFNFGGRSTYHLQHSHLMTFPGAVHIEREVERLKEAELERLRDSEETTEDDYDGLDIPVDSEIEIYARCSSVNDRWNREEFLFQFCIEKGPDTTPPEIRGFNWEDRSPVAFFTEDEDREVDIQVYTNEPSECKWDWEDKEYDEMENELRCEDKTRNFNAHLSYICSGKLTGLENNKENDFYFRCKDQPRALEKERNENRESEKLTLIGTESLFISNIGPNATTEKGGTSPLKVTLEVETRAGYRRGDAVCFYSRTGDSGTYRQFSDTDSHEHSTNLRLDGADGGIQYEYFIRCHDFAGNSDTKQISFTVETDTTPPVIVRAYKEGNQLKIITDEDAECVYDNVDCSYEFDPGNRMESTDGIVHSTEWNANRNYHIKCKDNFGNQPGPNQCSMTVRPFDVA